MIQEERRDVVIPKAMTLGWKKRDVPAVTVIHCDRAELERVVGTRAGAGSQKSPHDRRGHTRRLRDGRVINVRPCQIHGGSGGQRLYKVKP